MSEFKATKLLEELQEEANKKLGELGPSLDDIDRMRDAYRKRPYTGPVYSHPWWGLFE